MTEPSDHRLRVLDAAIIVAGLLCFLALLSWASQRDIDAAVEMHKAAAQRYAAMLAQCLNGGTLYDRANNTAHFCTKVVSVRNP